MIVYHGVLCNVTFFPVGVFPTPGDLAIHVNDTHKYVQWNSVNTTSSIHYVVCTNVTNVIRCENTSELFYYLPMETMVEFNVTVRAVSNTCTGEIATIVYTPPEESTTSVAIPENKSSHSDTAAASVDSSYLSPTTGTPEASIIPSPGSTKGETMLTIAPLQFSRWLHDHHSPILLASTKTYLQ